LGRSLIVSIALLEGAGSVHRREEKLLKDDRDGDDGDARKGEGRRETEVQKHERKTKNRGEKKKRSAKKEKKENAATRTRKCNLRVQLSGGSAINSARKQGSPGTSQRLRRTRSGGEKALSPQVVYESVDSCAVQKGPSGEEKSREK